MEIKPKEVHRRESGLEIVWSDSTKSFCTYGKMRKTCSCAVCKEQKTPISEELPFYQRSISLRQMQLVGNYAIEILWGDGHRSIVAFDRMRTYEA